MTPAPIPTYSRFTRDRNSHKINEKVTANRKTEGEVFKDFMLNWNSKNKDYVVSLEEFENYFEVKLG